MQASDCAINYLNKNKSLLPYLQSVILFLTLTSKNAIFICLGEISFLCPPPKGRGGGGQTVFGADPVGVNVGVGVGVTLSCLHDISWTGGCILIKFTRM